MYLVRICVGTAAVATVSLLAMRVFAGDDAGPAPPEKPTYVGDSECKACHFKQHSSWKKTTMANAMKSLATAVEADDKTLFDKKKAAGLDPSKDYSADATCLPCHTTGYGAPGGYPIDPKKDAAAVKAAALMGKVSCEACHGPGSLYVKHKHAVYDADKSAKFTWDELAKLGLTKPDAASCAACHDLRTPTRPCSPWFEQAKAKVHDHPAPGKPTESATPGK